MADLILRGGTVFDGTGALPVIADIAVTDDRITEIGDLSHLSSGKVVDVTGCAVAPGFIDIHTHSDFHIFGYRPMRSSLAQGVTTEMMGNCGVSVGLVTNDPVFGFELKNLGRDGVAPDWAGIAEFLQRIEDGGSGCNVATLAGHGTIRKTVMGMRNDAPTGAELARMQALLAGALEDGAFGFSTGLEYLPSGYADLPEQVALASVLRDAGGFYATHMRNEGDQLVESVQEALDVAAQAGVSLQISHHKSEGQKNWGKVAITLRMMQEARQSGLDVLTDQYPYDAFMTGLAVILLPQWANAGSPAEGTERLRDPALRAQVIQEIEADPPDWTRIHIGISQKRRDVQGLNLVQLGARENKTPLEAALDLIADEEGWVAAVNFAMSEEDIEAVLRDPHTMIGSDGVTNDPQGPLAADKPHPRTYGTFPRVLSRYVREREVITLSEAVRRMTSLPAQRLKLTDRGRLAVGMKADITVFDPNTIQDCATFDDPHQYPLGVRHVLVNGRLAVENGAHTGTLAGTVLRRA